jgi:hypothetical protein
MGTRSVVFTLVVLAVMFGVAGASLAEQFSESSLKGAGGFSAQGTLGGAPAATVGLINFDGNGGCSETATLNVGGSVVTLSTTPNGSCSYDVNADGTGILNVNFPPAFTAHFVIVDSKQEFHFIVADTGAIASGVAKRQRQPATMCVFTKKPSGGLTYV